MDDGTIHNTKLVFAFETKTVDRVCIATHCVITKDPCRHGVTWWCPAVRDWREEDYMANDAAQKRTDPCPTCTFTAWEVSAGGLILYCVVCDERSRKRGYKIERDEARTQLAAADAARRDAEGMVSALRESFNLSTLRCVHCSGTRVLRREGRNENCTYCLPARDLLADTAAAAAAHDERIRAEENEACARVANLYECGNGTVAAAIRARRGAAGRVVELARDYFSALPR